MILKRLFDLSVSLILIFLLSWLMIIVAILIRVKLGAPVIFKQKRPGRNGKIFSIFKFRSMTDAKDSMGNLLPNDQRLTSFGKLIRKLSLDELPQLFNVLKGDMSFVGPRPLLVDYLPLYNERQAKRHDVRPGITGWAQVNGRNAISWEQKFEYDVWYVENKSLLLDIKILFLTVKKVFVAEGVNKSETVTMERFTGSKKG